MAITNLGNASGTTATLTINVLAAVAAGTLVVLMASDNNANLHTTGAADSKGNTYTLGPVVNFNNAGLGIFYSFITTALTTSDTITYTSTGSGSTSRINASSITGYTAIDPATTNSIELNTSSNTLAGAGSAAVPNEIYVGGEALPFGGNYVAPDPPTGWSTTGFSSSNISSHETFSQVNSGTSPLSFTSTINTASGLYQVIMSFKPPAAGAAPASGPGYAEVEW